MKRPCKRPAFSAAAVLLALGAVSARADPNVVLRGGAIYTLNPQQPWAAALLISQGRIAYVGDDRGATIAGGPKADVIDLHGRMVLPGFHDGHAHPMSGGLRLLRCNLAGLKSAEQVYSAIRDCDPAKVRSGWLIVYNWSPQMFRRDSDWRRKLDALVPDQAAYIADTDGFTAWVNSRALAAGGIDPNGTSPPIDGLARDPVRRKPTGIVKGDALNRLRARFPKPTEADFREAFRRWSELANRAGITSVFDARAIPPMLKAYHDADSAGDLTLRVVAAQLVDPHQGPAQVDTLVAQRDRVRGRYFRANAAKIFLDGEISMHTAALLAPYADMPGARGELLIAPASLNAIVQRLDAEGFSIHMHAMGDAAVRAGLDSIEQAIAANGPKDRRHQIAHVGVADPTDLPRFAQLGVTANLQPGWFQADDPAMEPTTAVLGPARARLMYPAEGIAARGGRIVMDSDWPATSLVPLEGIQIAVTRQPLDGSKPAMRPEERIDLTTAIAAYTRNAAWVAREDDIDGSIETGKVADLVVLDRNLFRIEPATLHSAHVLLTLLDGKPVYRAPQFHWH